MHARRDGCPDRRHVGGHGGTRVSPASAYPTAAFTVDLDVTRSRVLGLGKSHVEAVSAFATHTDEFFGGRTKALKIHMFASPIDAAARDRLIKNDEDHGELTRGGSAVFVLFLDDQNRIVQANLTYIIPGTTVVRTLAWTQSDVAKWFSDYRFADGRLRLKTKGTYVTGPESPDEVLTLSWDVVIDTAVIEHLTRRGRGR